MESIVADRFKGRRQSKFFYRYISFKRTFADAHQAFRKIDRCKRDASAESVITDRRKSTALFKENLFHIAHIVERVVSDIGNACRNDELSNIILASESAFADCSNNIGNTVRTRFALNIAGHRAKSCSNDHTGLFAFTVTLNCKQQRFAVDRLEILIFGRDFNFLN